MSPQLQCVADTINKDFDLTGNLNTDPVVTYFLDASDSSYSWVAAWTLTAADPVKNPAGDMEGVRQDVVARRYNLDGTPWDSHHYYSFVNSYLDSNQYLPSIAGRYSGASTNIGYAFAGVNVASDSVPRVYYKLSPDVPGRDAFNDEPTYNENCLLCHSLGLSGRAPDSLSLYPNPGRELFSMRLASPERAGKCSVTLTDSKGLLLLKRDWSAAEGEAKIQTKDLLPGAYKVRVITESGKMYSKTFIKN